MCRHGDLPCQRDTHHCIILENSCYTCEDNEGLACLLSTLSQPKGIVNTTHRNELQYSAREDDHSHSFTCAVHSSSTREVDSQLYLANILWTPSWMSPSCKLYWQSFTLQAGNSENVPYCSKIMYVRIQLVQMQYVNSRWSTRDSPLLLNRLLALNECSPSSFIRCSLSYGLVWDTTRCLTTIIATLSAQRWSPANIYTQQITY